MYFNNAGWLLSLIYPSLVWRRKVKDKILYLTFDDGPIPVVTQFVLDELAKYNAKATFFCVGDNIYKHPEVFERIVSSGHKVGNHTFNHLKGWKTEDEKYYGNIRMCDEIIKDNLPESGQNYISQYSAKRMFRPPYGLISKSQIRQLRASYEIIMWDVLTGDFNKNLDKEKCLQKAIKYTKKGAIVIFHDSLKAEDNLRYVLPEYLKYFTSLGYRFESL